MTPISKRQGAPLYIYIILNVYIYTKIQTLCKKQDNLRQVFVHKKPDTLVYAIFHEIFEIGIDIYI